LIITVLIFISVGAFGMAFSTALALHKTGYYFQDRCNELEARIAELKR
jgi:hypothetical protein